MTSFLMKLILCPLIIGIASFILPNVNYSTVWQVIGIGIVIALVGTGMEYFLLNENTVMLSTILDFIAATLIIYIGTNMLVGAAVTLWGAILVGLVIGVTEYFTHGYLVATDKTEKQLT